MALDGLQIARLRMFVQMATEYLDAIEKAARLEAELRRLFPSIFEEAQKQLPANASIDAAENRGVMGRPRLDIDTGRIQAAITAGFSVRQIAKELNLPHMTVYNRIKELRRDLHEAEPNFSPSPKG